MRSCNKLMLSTCLFSLSVALTGCTGTRTLHDPVTADSAVETATTRTDVRWKTQLPGGCVAGSNATSFPVVSNGRVYVGSSDGAVYALSAKTGALQWRFQTGEGLGSGTEILAAPPGSSAAEMLNRSLESAQASDAVGKRQISAAARVDGDAVLIGSWDHNFYALDAETGVLKWKFDAGLPISHQAVLANHNVIFTTSGKASASGRGDGRIYALDSVTGKPAWVFDTLPEVEAKAKWPANPISVTDGIVFATNWNAARYTSGADDPAATNVYAIDAASGQALWKSRTDAAWPSAPVVTEKFVLFTSSDRAIKDSIFLHGLDRFTGAQKWRYAVTGGENFWKLNEKTPLVAHEKIAIVTTDTFIVGLDLATGNELWRWNNALPKKPVNQAYLGSFLYVVTGDTLAPTVGALHAIELETGTTVWTRSMYARNKIRAAVDGVVYIQTAILRTALTAVEAATGKELGTVWSLAIGMFRNESTRFCAGPVRDGNQLLVSTADEVIAGAGRSQGYVYSVAAPTR